MNLQLVRMIFVNLQLVHIFSMICCASPAPTHDFVNLLLERVTLVNLLLVRMTRLSPWLCERSAL